MSVVGPRPPIASEVTRVQAQPPAPSGCDSGNHRSVAGAGRQDPSFDSYISLDVTYIENWSVWLDIKIILRTIAVVFAGTGS